MKDPTDLLEAHLDAPDVAYAAIRAAVRAATPYVKPPVDTNPWLGQEELLSEWRRQRGAGHIQTGIPSLDKAVGGIPVRKVTTLLGYAKVGKSEVVRHLRMRAGGQGVRVLHVDVELGVATITNRCLAQLSGLPDSVVGRDDLRGEEAERLEKAIGEFLGLPALTMSPGGMNLADLGEKIKEATEGQESPALLILDSAQRLADMGPGNDARERLTMFYRWAEHLARTLPVAVLVPAEMKRASKGAHPDPGDLLTSGAESRAVEYVSDLILALVPQDGAEDREAGDAGDHAERKVAVCIVATRQGADGYLAEDLVFERPCWGMRTEIRRSRAELLTDEVEAAILVLSKDGASVSTSAITEAVKGRTADIRRVLRDLEDAGTIAQTGTPSRQRWVHNKE